MSELLAARYEVGAVLGATALSIVHRGRDTHLDRPVAVTLLRQELDVDAASVGLFTATVAVQAELSHPGIVGVYDAGVSEYEGVTVHWAVGELVLGFNIDQFVLPAQMRADWGGTLLELADELAQVMQHVHVDGAVHGNLSPSTVLLDLGSNDRLRARITGFGPQAADLALPSDPQTTRQMWQIFIEQLKYPSPEQKAGRAPTRRSDVYGFGCVLAALILLGERTDVSAQGHLDPDGRPDARHADVVRALTTIAEQAMDDVPGARQSSFTEVREQLQRIDGMGEKPDADAAFASDLSSPDTKQPVPVETTELRYLGISANGPRRARRARPVPVKRRERSARGGWLFAALAAVTALVGSVGWGVTEANSQQVDSVTIPSVVGAELTAATKLLGSLGFSLGGQVSRADAAVAVGLVVGTDPVAGSRLRSGEPVTLVISTGPDARAVPQLQGLSLASAQDALAASGLVAGAVVERDGLVVPGVVLGSDPEFGALVAAGAAVQIDVASGNQKVPLSLGGQAAAAASQTLAAAGLAPQLVLQSRDDIAPGVVITVTPAEGTSLPLGSIVTLTAAEAPAPVRLGIASPEPTETQIAPTPRPINGGADGG